MPKPVDFSLSMNQGTFESAVDYQKRMQAFEAQRAQERLFEFERERQEQLDKWHNEERLIRQNRHQQELEMAKAAHEQQMAERQHEFAMTVRASQDAIEAKDWARKGTITRGMAFKQVMGLWDEARRTGNPKIIETARMGLDEWANDETPLWTSNGVQMSRREALTKGTEILASNETVGGMPESFVAALRDQGISPIGLSIEEQGLVVKAGFDGDVSKAATDIRELRKAQASYATTLMQRQQARTMLDQSETQKDVDFMVKELNASDIIGTGLEQIKDLAGASEAIKEIFAGGLVSHAFDELLTAEKLRLEGAVAAGVIKDDDVRIGRMKAMHAALSRVGPKRKKQVKAVSADLLAPFYSIGATFSGLRGMLTDYGLPRHVYRKTVAIEDALEDIQINLSKGLISADDALNRMKPLVAEVYQPDVMEAVAAKARINEILRKPASLEVDDVAPPPATKTQSAPPVLPPRIVVTIKGVDYIPAQPGEQGAVQTEWGNWLKPVK